MVHLALLEMKSANRVRILDKAVSLCTNVFENPSLPPAPTRVNSKAD